MLFIFQRKFNLNKHFLTRLHENKDQLVTKTKTNQKTNLFIFTDINNQFKTKKPNPIQN